ncbi:MAG TPA: hypothetical protein DDZ89_20415, partial [Clostridiales bacterium]|nr:hypothetical protein [Clostridiales bacterium]
KVISQTMTTVTVIFREKYGTKKFIYPSAFESFLVLCDSTEKAEMDDELRQIRERAQEEERKRAEEDEERREEERRAILEQKRAITKKRSSVKKTPAKPKNKSED